MASVNKCILVGNLTRDPESRTFPDGGQITNVSLATNHKWKDKTTGEIKEATEFHRIVFNGLLAEIAGQYLRKGSQVYVEGSLRTRKWTDQSGQERYTTEIRADSMQMLGGRGGAGGAGTGGSDDGYDPPAPAPRSAPAPQRQAAAPSSNSMADLDDDIPFRDPLSYRGVHLAC